MEAVRDQPIPSKNRRTPYRCSDIHVLADSLHPCCLVKISSGDAFPNPEINTTYCFPRRHLPDNVPVGPNG